MENKDKLTLSIVEAAVVLGVSKYATYAAVKNGELPVLKIGRRLLVPKAQLMVMLKCDSEALHQQRASNSTVSEGTRP